jgi:hypothetical protein
MTEEIPKLYTCEPVDWLFLPKFARTILGWTTILIFGFSFLTIPMCSIFLIPQVWRYAPVFSGVCVSTVVLSMVFPLKEWYGVIYFCAVFVLFHLATTLYVPFR